MRSLQGFTRSLEDGALTLGISLQHIKRSIKKTFKSYCLFNGQERAEAYVKDTYDVPVYINHGGNTFPYWYRRASCNDEEFNQPDNVLGFRCVRMGFNVPRMEVATIPNNKTSENEVPMPTPMHAELWTFLDTNGDYGVPTKWEEGGHPYVPEHNDSFTNYFKGEIPTQTDRPQVWDKEMLRNINRDTIQYDNGTKTYTIPTPWDIYDLKMHPGYRSITATDATAFGMEFTPPEQKWTFFPHTQVAALNGSRGTECLTTGDDATSWDANIGNNKHLGQWPVNYIKTPVDNIIDTSAATQVNKVRMAHLRNTQGSFGATTVRWRNPNRSYIYTQNDDNSFGPTDIMLNSDLGGYATTQFNVTGLTSDGETNSFARFTQFIFGVHPDFERKANSGLVQLMVR